MNAALPKTFTFPRPAPLPDFSVGSPESFPAAALPTLLRSVAEDMARTYQTPLCLPAMATLAVLSGAVGRSVVVRGGFKDKDTRLNLYVIAAAERGTGKGNTGELLARPIAERSKLLRERQLEEAAARRGEVGILKKEIAKLESQGASAIGPERHQIEETLASRHLRVEELEREAKKQCTLMVSDCPSEALGRALDDNNETLFSFSSEAGAALKVALGKYTDGKGDFDLLLSGYSGDSVRVDRITRQSLELVSPCLSLFWMVQGVVLRELCGNPEAVERGLTARPLIFETGAERQLDDRSNNAMTTGPEWLNFINGVLDRRMVQREEPEIIHATPEARAIFSDFADESVMLGRGPFADVDGELTRWRENAIKVAGLFAVADGSDVLTDDHAKRGCALVRWAGFSYLSILSAGRSERQKDDLDRLLEILKARGGEITLRDLERHHGVKRPTVLSVIAVFPDRLELHKASTGTAGRPREILRHPAAKSAKSDKTPANGNNADNADFASRGAA